MKASAIAIKSVKVVDLRALLPRTSAPTFSDYEIVGLDVHHVGGEQDAFGVARYHVEDEGWDHVGYHFFIDDDGTLQQMLDIREMGYHAGYVKDAGDNLNLFPGKDPQYYNKHYLAVCLRGDLGKRAPTVKQMETLIALCVAFRIATGRKGRILGHRELPGKATACPGSNVDMNGVRAVVDQRLSVADEPPPTYATWYRPGEGDDTYFRRFPTWKDAAISTKGTADLFGNSLVDALREVQAVQEQARIVSGRLETLAAKLKKVVG